MPGGAEIIRLLPLIIRLFPEIVEAPLLGKVVPLINIEPTPDQDLERDLNRKIDVPKRGDGRKDSSDVLQLSEAIKVVEETFNETTLIKEFVLAAIQNLIAGRSVKACGQRMAEKAIEKLREKALRQDTPRIKKTETGLRRPARGHGHGRKS